MMSRSGALKWERWSHHHLGPPLRHTFLGAIRIVKEGGMTAWMAGWRGGAVIPLGQ